MLPGVNHGEVVVGVDIGGTKVAAGLVDCGGKILDQVRVPMEAQGSATEGFAAVTSAIDQLLAKHVEQRSGLRAIGICSPGPLDPYTGVVVNPPNLPCWRDFPLAMETSRLYRVPVKVDNDANAAALAEALWGVGQKYRSIFYATMGTGIGTGIVFNRQVYHGRTGAAGEGGHMSIDHRGPVCGCGKPGCIEAFAAGPAIAQRARTRLAEEDAQDSAIWQLAAGRLDAVTPEVVARADASGDAVAQQVLTDIARMLALWLSNVVDLLDPEVLIIGGGAACLLRSRFDQIHDWMGGFCVNSRAREIPLVPAHYGADSGIAGGAALCAQGTTCATIGLGSTDPIPRLKE